MSTGTSQVDVPSLWSVTLIVRARTNDGAFKELAGTMRADARQKAPLASPHDATTPAEVQCPTEGKGRRENTTGYTEAVAGVPTLLIVVTMLGCAIWIENMRLEMDYPSKSDMHHTYIAASYEYILNGKSVRATN